LHLVGDLFELYDDAQTYKLQTLNMRVLFIVGIPDASVWSLVKPKIEE